MKQLAYFLLITAGACVASFPAAMAAPSGDDVFQEEDDYEPILPDVGGDDEGGYRPDWANPNAGPSNMGVNEDPTPFNPSDPVGIPPNQD